MSFSKDAGYPARPTLSRRSTDNPRFNESLTQPISEYFGELTFGIGEMREKLPKEAYAELIRCLENGKKLSKETANAIAQVVKDWAVSKGATHFSHWFQPMTGLTAEKHDAFISIQDSYHSEIKVMERFSGSQLIQAEPDASSFPSGGMRSTFEARGYTVWDPTSPLFIVETSRTRTLCIPSVFFGYHGQSLDNKTPLLRSVQALSDKACELLKLMGDVDVKNVAATLGAEQEYFLIDREHAARRPDLIQTGRTLIGAPSARGQRLEDHYFGSIPSRVLAYMEELEYELFRLGIPVKTRHNEVAPSQFEMAPIFESISIATDHNALAMEIMKKVALRHGLVCLLHEKPFAAINGSGKHCNWSWRNDKGENLLEPGTTPHQNLRFLMMVATVMKAVHDHSDALRAAIASPGNEHRLGGNEAPPAIISVFLGKLLEDILASIEKGEAAQATEAQIINLGVGHIPNISKDYTDRNRTSPFAFTGNKFEFRAVGSSANIAVPMTMLNGAVADACEEVASRLKAKLANGGGNRDAAIMAVLRELVTEAKPVLFSGNGYSQEWREEAKRRKLPILDTSADAFEVLNKPERVSFLVRNNILSEEEIAARYHIAVERYLTTVEIELATLTEVVTEYVVPAIEKQLLRTHEVAGSITASALKKPYTERTQVLEETFGKVLDRLSAVKRSLDGLHEISDPAAKIRKMTNETMPLAKDLRQAADFAETQVADDLWPLPKYREMLFTNVVSA